MSKRTAQGPYLVSVPLFGLLGFSLILNFAGDRAEAQSIGRVFGKEAGRQSDVVIGSIKTNIGHLESASGIAGLLKAIMVLKKNQIPPNLHFINPKPNLRLKERGIKVQSGQSTPNVDNANRTY